MMLLGLMIVQPVASSSAGTVPIFQPKEVSNTFTPTMVGNSSYYIINPENTLYPPTYESTLPGVFTGTLLSTSTYYTTPNEISPKTSLSNTQSLYSTNNLITANPFINKQYAVPEAVQIDNNQSTLVSKEMTPFSIHIDKSMTFFGQNGKEYYAVLSQKGNILLDVNVQDSGSNVNVWVYSNNTLIQSKTSIQRASIPIFSTSGSYLIIISVNNANSLITLNPHELKNNMYYSNDIKVNESSQFTVKQGQCYTTGSNSISGSENLFSQVNLFNLPVQTDTYYQIVVDNQALDNFNYGCSNSGSVNPYLLNTTNDGSASDPITSMTAAQAISGSLNSNAQTLYALKAGNLQLAIESIGNLNNEVTVFFRSITPPKPQVQEFPLTLGKASYVYDAYNTFTLTQPSVVAVNYTNGAFYEGVTFYSYNKTSNVWNTIQTSYPSGYNPNKIPYIVNGNLITPGSNTLNYYNWIYMPSGTYAISNYDHAYYSNLKFTVTAVPVTTMSGTASQTVPITNTSIYAFAPTSNNLQFQFFNLTSSTHDNISVSYEYGRIGMYNEFYGSSGTTTFVGNQLLTNGWQGFYTNNSNMYTNIRYSELWSPIFIIHPYQALNATNSVLKSSYSTQLTVKANPFSGSNYAGNSNIATTPVSSSAPMTLNVASSGFSNGFTKYYYVPLTTDPNSLYNLTVHTLGNTTTYLNLTLNSIQVYGGALTNWNTGLNDISNTSATSDLLSQLILTQTDPGYLRISFSRYNTNTNGTIIIQLTKVSSNELNYPNSIVYNMNSLSWNKTVSMYESSDSHTLFKMEGPKTSPGFEVIALVIGLASLPILKKLKTKYRKS